MIISFATSSAYALTEGQKSIGDIGADITWFDFGDTYTSYSIQDNADAGIYALTISNPDDNISKTAFVNGKGELVVEPDTYDSGSSGGLGENVLYTKNGDHWRYVYVDSDGILAIDGQAYSEIGFF